MFTGNKNIKILVNYGVGPVLFAWLSWSIYRQVMRQPDIGNAWQQLKQSFTGNQSWEFWVALALVAVNWGIEARKWQLLMRPLEGVSFGRSCRAILAGLAFAMNTPNRVGEYGGRVLYVKEGHRWQAVALTIAGSLSQLIITLLIGSAGLVFILTDPEIMRQVDGYDLWIQGLLYGSIFMTVVVSLLYFRLGWMLKWLEKIPGSGRVLRKVVIIENLPVTILLRVLYLSLVRYIVFALQYILLLQLCGVHTGMGTAFWLVGVLYLMLSVIPTIALAELGIRGKLSLLLFMMVSVNKLGIITATTLVWLVNLVIPALAGSLLFLGLKIAEDK